MGSKIAKTAVYDEGSVGGAHIPTLEDHSHCTSADKLLLNPNLIEAKYAVRGQVLEVAKAMEQKLSEGDKLPYDELIYCNIGNPQKFKQKPITFYRQVLSGCIYPDEELLLNFPSDVIERIQQILADCGGNSVGSYSHSQGIPFVRETIADYIERRDGFPANPDHIFCCNGASDGVKAVMEAILFDCNHGIMVPIPQYPLYTATSALVGAHVVPYYLDESSTWSVSKSELQHMLKNANSKSIEVRAIVIINPGNPTGQCLEESDIEMILRFAEENNIVVLADEVYQENIYSPGKKFTSFRYVQQKIRSNVKLISFHSTSKGLLGECGLRGGYFELVNFSEYCISQFYKFRSMSLCPNTMGQICTHLMVTPPKKTQPSYKVFKKETQAIYDSLKERAIMTMKGLNEIEGISCQPVEGALYAFPKITMPQPYISLALENRESPDENYCIDLLRETGIVCVPGSGFLQEKNTHHLRLTILPPKHQIAQMLTKIKEFHDTLNAQQLKRIIE